MALRALGNAVGSGNGSLPALFRLTRSITSSSSSSAAQPQPQAAEPEHEQSAGPPRWIRELGVVRNDWT